MWCLAEGEAVMSDSSWDGSLATGDPVVDEQHREIHRILEYAETADDRPEERMAVLERLMDHVYTHFATEEDLMEATSYTGPAADDHKADHHRLTDEARGAVLGLRSGEITSMRPLVAMLQDWLVSHVQDHDRVFIEHVRAVRAGGE
jgi:hemerythrin-like metal-binding protein